MVVARQVSKECKRVLAARGTSAVVWSVAFYVKEREREKRVYGRAGGESDSFLSVGKSIAIHVSVSVLFLFLYVCMCVYGYMICSRVHHDVYTELFYGHAHSRCINGYNNKNVVHINKTANV